ncbi:MAG: PQQ-binding-like beta-propeller repeat protein [Candidatus Bathyarchaeota archaeon]|nr:PQQ-binding-like beta-propeller repeat protein [Candidatus Bathyarchaeota archaeon]
MKFARGKTMATAVALLLMFAMAVSIVALPNVNAQTLIMNPETHLVELHQIIDIDLNGPSSYIENVTLWVKYPGRTEFTYIDGYPTTAGGDLDVYDFDFNETGFYEIKWALPPDFTVESNVEIIECILEHPPSYWYTVAYVGATPNPVGVNQEVLLHVGITQQLMSVEMGWEGLSITIKRPDGKTDTISNIVTDSTGGTGRVYIPDIVGEYILQTHFPEQETTVTKRASGSPVGTIMLASDSFELTLVVQAEPLPVYPPHALPTEYWRRPIDAQLHEWSPISGNWMDEPTNLNPEYNDDAPETAHILWTKEMLRGGLGGGMFDDHSFECGDAYEGKFSSSTILAGVLYYNRYESRQTRQEVVAVDLHTGEELWCKPLLDPNDGRELRLSFGQMFYWDAWNYHAIFEYLWATRGRDWHAYNPLTGDWIYTFDGVPSGTTIFGSKGEIYRLNVNEGQGWMRLWNHSRCVNPGTSFGYGSWRPHGRTIDAGDSGEEWTVTIPVLPGSAYRYALGDRVVGYDLVETSSYFGGTVGVSQVIIWALSLKEGSEGSLLYKKTWNAPSSWLAQNQSISVACGSIEDGIIAFWSKDTRQYWAFSTETGDFLWGPTEPQNYLDFLGLRDYVNNGKLFSQGMSGIMYAYDAATGDLEWTYSADDPNNQVLWANAWSIRPLFFVDGKIYMGNSEHSPVDPKPRGGAFACIDMETGEEIFRADGMFRQTDWGGRGIIGDSIIATMDTYDQRVYAIGKGPSAITVNAGPELSVEGSTVVVKGMVTDISPGTQEYALTARFPDGVPAISDANMSEWMLYVYKQFERPADVMGVEVVVSVLDPNGNSYEVGTTTSDDSGFYMLSFVPEVPGDYTVIASFDGSKAYYGSFAKTAINVEEAPQATPVPTPVPQEPVGTYFTVSTVAIIAAIAIVAFLLLRRR